MSTREIARLLEDAAAHVPPPHLAEAAWRRVVQVRRRRRVAGSVAAAAAAVILSVLVGVPIAGRGPTGAPPNLPASTTAVSVVDRLPARLPPRSDLPWPRSVGDLRDAPRLTSGSITRADALYEPESATGLTPEPVYVLSGGVLHMLDVKLDWTTDATKRYLLPVSPTSLSPDGRLAAFGQLGEIVVVDLTTARGRHIPIGGFNRNVVWIDPRSVLVGGDGTYLVDAITGRVEKVAGNLSVAGSTGGDPVLELRASTGRLSLREWAAGAGTPLREIPIDQRALRPLQVTGWTGPAWRAGNLVARAGTARTGGSAPVPVVAVVNRHTGVMVRLLVLGAAGMPLGWLDPYTVVLRTDRDGLITWDVRDGALASAAAPFAGPIALAPS
jgi:hypothetical protein